MEINDLLTAGCVLSVDIVEVVIGLVVHCGDARLVGDVIECDDVPEYSNNRNVKNELIVKLLRFQ